LTAPIATPDTVKQAALELAELGQPVTADAVIKQLGGGSQSTVSPLLRDLLPQLGLLRSEASDIPGPVRSALNRAASALWATAREEARLDSEDVRRRYESFLAGQDRELQTISLERDQLAQHNAQLEASLRKQADGHAITQQLLRDRDEELRLSNERYRLAEVELFKLRERLERVEADQGGDRRQFIDLMTQLQTQFAGAAAPVNGGDKG
jgi:hypothetical protein